MACARLLSLTLISSIAALGAAEAVNESFANDAAIAGMTISGEAIRDADRSAAQDGSGSLRIGPKTKVVIPFRDNDGSGRVSFKVYEDGSKPEDPKARASGAFWGVQQSDGMALVTGAFYAPYLSGDGSYALSNFKGNDTPFSFIRYLGIKRSVGWHTWVFDFDADKGLTIQVDGQAITSKRFEWNESKQSGFNALVINGDTSGAGGNVWLDDVAVTLGGPMKVGPKPPEAKKVVPDKDPAVEGEVVKLVPAVAGVHPRLMFGPEDIPRLRAFYQSEEGASFKKELDEYLPPCVAPDDPKFLKDATDGQRQGYWRMPTVALHYVLTGDKTSFDHAVGYINMLLKLPNWETGSELDSGMSVANIMIGAGLTLDWLWNDLDPELREAFRAKCLYHARAMYHGGHLMGNDGTHYWQADPGNNHRWHRNAGLASCLLAASNGSADEAWIMTQFKKEFDFITQWLPKDGTSHESPTYMIFGLSHLVLTAQIVDHCWGTSYLQNDFFKNVPLYNVTGVMPDFQQQFNYGDQGGNGIGKLGYGLSLYKCTSVHRLANEQAALDRIRAEHGGGWGWMGLLWYDPTLTGGEIAKLPTSVFYDDVGVLFARDSWADDGKGVMFKCGPLGGFTLNRFRNGDGTKAGYINVAHDDPDANTFLIYSDHEYVIETDRYSEAKKSANHNTILVNGSGQMTEGRPEGMVWSQPATSNADMTKLAFATASKITDGFDVVEGEAGPSYRAITNGKDGANRPQLERYRRALVFAKGSYVLVMDDIRAPSPVEISWLVQGPDLQAANAVGSYVLSNGDVKCPFQFSNNHADATTYAIVESSADTKKKKLMGWKQLRAVTTTDHLITASAYDLYGHGVAVALDTSDPAKIVVTVTSNGIDDRWEWIPAEKADATYQLTGTRAGETLISVGEADRPKP